MSNVFQYVCHTAACQKTRQHPFRINKISLKWVPIDIGSFSYSIHLSNFPFLYIANVYLIFHLPTNTFFEYIMNVNDHMFKATSFTRLLKNLGQSSRHLDLYCDLNFHGDWFLFTATGTMLTIENSDTLSDMILIMSKRKEPCFSLKICSFFLLWSVNSGRLWSLGTRRIFTLLRCEATLY